jgi:hypothetical protein
VSDNILLDLMNRYKYPKNRARVNVVLGRHGELAVFARVVEAWEFWAETNGYSDWGQFADDFEDQMEWSDNGNRVFLDECGSLNQIEVQGYYRDGKDNL